MTPRQQQAATILRGHPDWRDDMIASITGLTAAEVAEVRQQMGKAA